MNRESENWPTALFQSDVSGHITYANARWIELLGRDDFPGKDPVGNLHPDDRERMVMLWTDDVADPSPRGFTARLRLNTRPRGWRWVDITLTPIRGASGELVGYAGAAHDVTELVDVRQRSLRFQRVLEATSDLVAIVREDLEVQYLNPAARMSVGLPDKGDANNFDLASRFAPLEWDRVVTEATEALSESGAWHGVSTFRRADGREVLLSHVIVTGDDDDGTSWFASLGRDIAGDQLHRAALLREVTIDDLTGLLNRNALVEALAEKLRHAASKGGIVGLLFVDVDQLKLVNDSFGHETGDELLVVVADRLRELSGEHAVLGRFGGDKFAVVIDALTTRAAVHRRADELLSGVAGVANLEAGDVHVSVSIGVVTDDGLKSAGDLLRDADATVSLAKRRGRARLEIFERRVHDEVVTRLATEQELRRGLETGQFLLHFQPVIDLTSGKISGAEALVRWKHPQLGLLLPGEFLPVIEESGLGGPLGSWVLNAACRAAASWDLPTSKPFRVAVNLSADQLGSGNFVEEVAGVLDSTGLPGDRLILEITEGIAMADADATVLTLSQLRKLGVLIAIDDFGTGYSSLSHLTRLPIDVLKVDQSFIRGLETSQVDLEVTSTIIGLAHSLNMKAIAEGVETREQLDIVRDLGCDVVQGFYFSRPVPEVEMVDLLTSLDTSLDGAR